MLLYVYHFWEKIRRKYRDQYSLSRTELDLLSPSDIRLNNLQVGKVGFYYKINETEWTSKNYVEFINNGVITAKKVKILTKPRNPNVLARVIILDDTYEKGRKINVDGRNIIRCNKKNDLDSTAFFINCKFLFFKFSYVYVNITKHHFLHIT